MKLWIIIIAMLAVSAPAFAQLGGIGRRVQKAQERKQKFDDLNITEEEEIKIGADVSAKIRERFGVVQDPAVHKYVDARRHDAGRADDARRSCRGRSSCWTPTASTRSPRPAGSCTSRAARSR